MNEIGYPFFVFEQLILTGKPIALPGYKNRY